MQNHSSELREGAKSARGASGYTMLEVSLTVVLSLVLAAFTVPLVQSSVNSYRFRAAVASATWAIQATRYQAIMKGYPYQITFDPAALTYQVASRPPGATAFTNVGDPVPLSGSAITLNQKTTLQFKPNGLVQVTTGLMSFALTYGTNTSTISVSSFGNVSVSH